MPNHREPNNSDPLPYWSERASQVVVDLIARRAWFAAGWEDAHAVRLNALPVGMGMGNEYYLRPNGEVVDVDFSDDRCDQMFYRDRSTTIMALRMGSRIYPELLSLIPPRPADAVVCKTCREIIKLPGLSELYCDQCGGLRWLPAKTRRST